MTTEPQKQDEEAAEAYICRPVDYKFDDQPTSISIEARNAFLAGSRFGYAYAQTELSAERAELELERKYGAISKALAIELKDRLEASAEREKRLREIILEIQIESGLDNPNFGNFTPLMFAARLGLIDIKCREALKGGA